MRESKIWKWQDSLRQGVRKIVMKEEVERNNPLFLGVFFIVVGFGLLVFFIYLLFLKEEVELLGNIDEKTFTAHVLSCSIQRFSLPREEDFPQEPLINLGDVAWSKPQLFSCLKGMSIAILQKRIYQNEANYFLSKIHYFSTTVAI